MIVQSFLVECFVSLLMNAQLCFQIDTVNFNHKFGCQKCMMQGEYFRSAHRMSFHRVVATEAERTTELRTDDRFRNRFQPEHHTGDSILENLPIDMVKSFVVSDSLHLLDLGLMKRYSNPYI